MLSECITNRLNGIAGRITRWQKQCPIHEPLVDPERGLTPSQNKLGLIKQFVEALDVQSQAFYNFVSQAPHIGITYGQIQIKLGRLLGRILRKVPSRYKEFRASISGSMQ